MLYRKRGKTTMAFTLQIKQKKLFGKTALDIPSLARACGFRYGSNNDFYILQEEEQNQGRTASRSRLIPWTVPRR